jgi:erythromycin esterase-like protein
MFGDRVSSWNLRDQHMAETLNALADHVGRQRGVPARIVVWAHNSHLGDARATEMSAHGERNVGQLVRERHGDAARLIGFTTFAGTVTAADDWGAPADRLDVRPAHPRTERQSHYFRSRVADQVDALIHIDGTRAVVPLERTSRWDVGEAPETYPHAV